VEEVLRAAGRAERVTATVGAPSEARSGARAVHARQTEAAAFRHVAPCTRRTSSSASSGLLSSRPPMRHRLPALLSLCLLAACGADAAKNPIAGDWHFDGGEHAKPAEGHSHALQFDRASDKFTWCTDDGGAHDHFDGTYRLEGDKVTLQGTWKNTGKAETVTGTLQDKNLSLQFASGKKSFHQH
jgi:hypothetical protein